MFYNNYSYVSIWLYLSKESLHSVLLRRLVSATDTSKMRRRETNKRTVFDCLVFVFVRYSSSYTLFFTLLTNDYHSFDCSRYRRSSVKNVELSTWHTDERRTKKKVCFFFFIYNVSSDDEPIRLFPSPRTFSYSSDLVSIVDYIFSFILDFVFCFRWQSKDTKTYPCLRIFLSLPPT